MKGWRALGMAALLTFCLVGCAAEEEQEEVRDSYDEWLTGIFENA